MVFTLEEGDGFIRHRAYACSCSIEIALLSVYSIVYNAGVFFLFFLHTRGLVSFPLGSFIVGYISLRSPLWLLL